MTNENPSIFFIGLINPFLLFIGAWFYLRSRGGVYEFRPVGDIVRVANQSEVSSCFHKDILFTVF